MGETIRQPHPAPPRGALPDPPVICPGVGVDKFSMIWASEWRAVCGEGLFVDALWREPPEMEQGVAFPMGVERGASGCHETIVCWARWSGKPFVIQGQQETI